MLENEKPRMKNVLNRTRFFGEHVVCTAGKEFAWNLHGTEVTQLLVCSR